ncbi:MAG: DUF4212 domain-containing protein [Hyphomicrobiaceae bacterium]|nr:DUF4212 domain-containing protein [Hyphomicrobiaceae bacterium]
MLEIFRDEQRTYWRHTKLRVFSSLLLFLVPVLILPLYIESLNNYQILGFPLGYLVVGHGVWIFAFSTIITYNKQQDAIDHWYCANEDV